MFTPNFTSFEPPPAIYAQAMSHYVVLDRPGHYTAKANEHVIVGNGCELEAYDGCEFIAQAGSTVSAYAGSKGRANDNSTVNAFFGSLVIADSQAYVIAYSGSKVVRQPRKMPFGCPSVCSR